MSLRDPIWWVLWIQHRPTGNCQDLALEAHSPQAAATLAAQIIGPDWFWDSKQGVEPMNEGDYEP